MPGDYTGIGACSWSGSSVIGCLWGGTGPDFCSPVVVPRTKMGETAADVSLQVLDLIGI